MEYNLIHADITIILFMHDSGKGLTTVLFLSILRKFIPCRNTPFDRVSATFILPRYSFYPSQSSSGLNSHILGSGLHSRQVGKLEIANFFCSYFLSTSSSAVQKCPVYTSRMLTEFLTIAYKVLSLLRNLTAWLQI